MKNIVKVFASIALVFTLSSCSDFLVDKPESVLPQNDFYTTTARINMGIIGCYQGMASVMKEEWKFTEMRSDNTCMGNVNTGSGERVDLADLALFRPSSSLPVLQNYWYLIFQNISNINSVLPSVLDNSYVTVEPKRAQFEAELRFMRAYHYFTLVNLWGDMFKVTKVIGPNEAKTLTRRPVAEIYSDIIIPDLKIAAANAPETYTTTESGRITKWAAKSMLAKVYMQMGGADNLALAKALLQEVLACPSFGLLTDAGASSPSAYANIFNVANEMNKEIVFAIRYLGGSSGIGSPFWTIFAPDNSANILLKIGTPIGNNNPTLEVMNLFKADPADKRTDACFRTWMKGTSPIPYISKFIDPNMTQANQSENDWPVIRYADLVLLYAEIMAQDGNFATAHNEVNKVRARAGVAALPAFTSPTEALDAIYKERRLELAFENQRWFDLLRMNNSYGDPNKAMSILKQHTFVTDWVLVYSKYSPLLPPTENFFINERLLLPIPQTEIDINTDIKIPNNPSY